MNSFTAAMYIDPHLRASYPLDQPRWRSDAGNPLMLAPLPGITREQIDTSLRSIWRYHAALPPGIPDPVSLGEGCTPLLPVRWDGATIHCKLEWFSPTGSFKDRGASVMISFLRSIGVASILEDSSGNGGAAIAAYAAAAELRAKILAPAHTSPVKIDQMRAFGAEVELVPGDRQATAREAIRQSEHIFYASHNWHPFFLQGTKTIAYELWEDLGYRAPDNIVIPTGAGSNVLGCDIGFSELLCRGQIERLPRLFAAQPANCAPIDASFHAGVDHRLEVEIRPTVAEGTAISHPVRLGEVLQAIRRSGGGTVAVSEQQIIDAYRRLAGLGLFAEPTSAAAAAAAERLLQDGTIHRQDVTVVLLTGSGFKSAIPSVDDR